METKIFLINNICYKQELHKGNKINLLLPVLWSKKGRKSNYILNKKYTQLFSKVVKYNRS